MEKYYKVSWATSKFEGKDIIKKIHVGDIVKAKVIERENADGYVELSLKEARQALIWNAAEEAIKAKEDLILK